MRCLPFSEAVYRGLQEQGLDAGQLLNNPSTYQRKGSWYHNSDALENDLLWLICVGVLRREVDGHPLPGAGRPRKSAKADRSRVHHCCDTNCPCVDTCWDYSGVGPHRGLVPEGLDKQLQKTAGSASPYWPCCGCVGQAGRWGGRWH